MIKYIIAVSYTHLDVYKRQEFMNSFVERVDIYEDERPNGRFLKHIKFKFPVFFDGEEIQELSWDNETTVETVVLLCRHRSRLTRI